MRAASSVGSCCSLRSCATASALMAAAIYPLTELLPPAAALAVGIPLSLGLYLLLLRGFMPEGLQMLLRPLRDLARRPEPAAR